MAIIHTGYMGLVAMIKVCRQCDDIGVQLTMGNVLHQMHCNKCGTNEVAVYTKIVDTVAVFD